MLKVQRSVQCDADLVDIWLTIAEDDPGAADRLLDDLERRWTHLADHPLMGMARPDIAPGARQLSVRNYLILYRAEESRILIVRVLHGRRDLTDL